MNKDEIRFRGKTNKNGIWVSGNLVQHGNRYFIFGGGWTANDGELEWNKYEVMHKSIGQYIGMNDVDGTYIYTGHKVEFTNVFDESTETAIVLRENTEVILEGVCKTWNNKMPFRINPCTAHNIRIIGDLCDLPQR